MLIIVYLDGEQIARVGLYEKATMKWIKWLPKKKYKVFSEVHHIEVKECVL